ncbi:hypothetical protein CCAX7_16650 [Capsulimonas corticalis]|uniref:Uncharacterized protein n=2 Tax=Capsulimonas corticalis TaxID=2219043 RepID=A0A402CYZ0_9BACT|nr:hypothetical protein CCAX7_16650 [Capsulimonas corticalis]
MENKSETLEAGDKSQWPPQPDRDYRVLQMGISKIEFDGHLLKVCWKTLHPLAASMIGLPAVWLFMTAKELWGIQPFATLKSHKMLILLHYHPLTVIAIFALIGAQVAIGVAMCYWVFRVAERETLSIDLNRRTVKLANQKELPMTAIAGIRVRVASTTKKKLAFVDIGVAAGGRKKVNWRGVALMNTQEDAAIAAHEISEFTGIPIVV